MRFEFDHKTGTMQPKKNEQIYFAKSMGGGLRVDDHKHNMKYIIERDGGFTPLQVPRMKNYLHQYDQRDAHIIADRVARMFGRNHKYANYRMFLVGVSESYIKGFDEFVNEDFSKLYKRWHAGEVRDEDKARIEEFINKKSNKDEYYITDGDVVNCKGKVEITDDDLIDGKFPVKFGKVDGDFHCDGCKSLKSLEGAPKEVGGCFSCVRCKSLKSLEGAPKEVGGYFSCASCESLKSLEGAPETVGSSFICFKCFSLTSLKGAPKTVKGIFCCDECESLTSLEGVTEKN